MKGNLSEVKLMRMEVEVNSQLNPQLKYLNILFADGLVYGFHFVARDLLLAFFDLLPPSTS